jgi:CheY-like chemotaxis protein
MNVATAHNAAEVLQQLRLAATSGSPFDVALLDVHTPDGNGIALAQTIHADPLLTHTRLLILTSLDLHLDAEAWHRAGVDAYLVKPLKQSRVLESLATVLGTHPSATHRLTSPDPAYPHGPPAIVRPRNIRVLVAEDNAVNQKIALRQLKKLGYAADAVANGHEAINALRRIPYDIILMDCQMPEMDGFQAARKIRDIEADPACSLRPPVYIIAMTANAMEGNREVCLSAGMNDYVSKPVKLHELQDVLARAPHFPPPPQTQPQTDPSQFPSHNPQAVIDPVALASLRALRDSAEEDLLGDLIKLFLRDMPGKLSQIQSAVTQSQPPILRDCAHSLKGSASNLGARRLAQLCAQLEAIAQDPALTGANALLPDLRMEFQLVCEALKAEIRK